MRLGADVDDLDAVARRLADWARRLDGDVAAVTGLATSAWWQGPHADRFRSDWGRHRASLQAAARLLDTASTQLRDQSAAQRSTSQDTDFPGAAAAAASPDPSGPVTPPDDVFDPPGDPATDAGAGEHGSQPWYARGDDVAFEGLARGAVEAAELLGLTTAARHLDHYLDNSGDDLTVDPDQIVRDVPAFGDTRDAELRRLVDAAAADAVASGRTGEPIPFDSGWQGFYLTKEASQDWFYAMGGIQYAVSGYLVVSPGDPPSVEVHSSTHVFDRYNWDEGKKVTIGGIDIHDKDMGELHTAGLAQEYDMRGSTEEQVVTWDLGDDQPEGPAGDAGRDGQRSDPGRDSPYRDGPRDRTDPAVPGR